MIESFAADIEAWHDFYMLAGSAAATLLGLLFVAVSLHIDIIPKIGRSGDVMALALQTFVNFLIILSFAFIFMIPGQGPSGTGIPLLFISLSELWRTARLWKSFGFGGGKERILDIWDFRLKLLIPNTVCYIALIFISVELLLRNTSYLGWMVMIIIWLLIAASQNAWILMLRLAELRQEHKANG
ncbi:MAG: hypothetical protein ACE14P_08285 [Methanotrichaceae archaeon]